MTSERPKKVLIVDDTEATRYAVARILSHEGYVIVEAGTGAEALALVHSERPDLVTLDIHLPDMLGFEVCRRIKGDPRTADLPVLQVSASYVTSVDRVHGLEGGADSYLTHPFEPPVLIATVRALLRARGLTEKLRLAEEKIRVALKHAPIMIYTTDADLRYTWVCNPPAAMPNERFIGFDDHDVLPLAEAGPMMAHKLDVLQSGQGKRVTADMTFGVRTYVYDVTIEPVLDADGRGVGLTVACVDVTERLRAEEAQRLAFLDAEYANQAKSRFLANMSHEIRTPLGVIQGYADLALEERASVDERRQYLLTIKRNARDLTMLLGDILDLAKIEAGRIDIEKIRFSLPGLLREVVDGLAIHGRARSLDLQLVVDELVPEYAHTDAGRLRQILVNLISNAIKFTESGFVRVRARAVNQIESSKSWRVAVTIEDSGIGLSESQSERLFEPFMQADSSTTRKFGGTGLGLNLSRKLSRALGGDLHLVTSRLGEGSTFEMTFDSGALVDAAAEGEAFDRERWRDERESVVVGNLLGMNILLVEDCEDNQVLFMHYLRTMGAKVELAIDGVEGLSKARSASFDAILMDIQMPNLDGHGVTHALRKDGNRVPIVALTAHALKEERDRALAHGFDGYLTKPLNPRLLIDALTPYRPL